MLKWKGRDDENVIKTEQFYATPFQELPSNFVYTERCDSCVVIVEILAIFRK